MKCNLCTFIHVNVCTFIHVNLCTFIHSLLEKDEICHKRQYIYSEKERGGGVYRGLN